MNEIGFDVVARRPLSEMDWRSVLRLQCGYPFLVPERYGFNEPLENEFDIVELEEAVAKCWANPLSIKSIVWHNRKTGWEGDIGFRYSPMRSYGPVAMWHRLGNKEREFGYLSSYLQNVSLHLDCLFSFVHLLAEPEIPRWEQDAARVVSCLSTKKQFYSLGITPMLLRHWLPDLFWGNVFGKPYVEMFGRERLLSAPAYLVKEIAPNMIYLQLSESITDMHTKFSQVDATRSKVKEHLKLDAFWRADASHDHRYVVPQELLE
jgi:hypothetical protein